MNSSNLPEWLKDGKLYEKGLHKGMEKWVVCEKNVNSEVWEYSLNEKNKSKILKNKKSFPKSFLTFLIVEETFVCEIAAKTGQLELLKYSHINSYFWDEQVCINAIEFGHLECLIYAHENNCPLGDKSMSFAAASSHLECLQYVTFVKTELLSFELYQLAVINNRLDNLKHLHSLEKMPVWDEIVCIDAASSGSYECLVYLHESFCPWDSRTCKYAALKGFIKCLKYAVEHNCPINTEECLEVARNKNIRNYLNSLKK